MARYGLGYYGIDSYGPDVTVEYSASPFTAQSINYSSIRLKWTNPYGDWSKIMLVRNSYGFPMNIYDGTALKVDGVNEFQFREAANTSFIDNTGISPEAFYYYSIFVFETTNYTWINVGNTIGVSVKDYGAATKMYNWLPNIYKIQYPYVPTADWDNQDLFNFLGVYAFELNYLQTITSLLNYRYDYKRVSGVLVPSILYQLGYNYEKELGLQQARKLMRDGVALNMMKGSKRGIIDFLKAYTGYNVPEPDLTTAPNPSKAGITLGANLMLDYNDSSFEESYGNWASSDNTAALANPRESYIKYVSLTGNVATLTIGAHSYAVGTKVSITNTPYPLFNLATQTITAVGSTTISFALTASDVPTLFAYNYDIDSYGKVTPAPPAYDEIFTATLFPNRQKGVLAIKNSGASAQDINISCGKSDPIASGIPVTAGEDYTFSVYTAKSSTAKTVTVGIEWYDRFGAIISTSTGTGVSNNTTVFDDGYRPDVTDTAPVDAYYAVPTIKVTDAAGTSSNQWHYFDCAQFEAGTSVTDFSEARQLNITLRATRINELINPKFAGGITPWKIDSTPSATTAIITNEKEYNTDVYSVTASAISNLAGTSTVTITLNYTHAMAVGSSVVITGATGVNAASINGTKTITAVSGRTFQFTFAGAVTQASAVETGEAFPAGNFLKITSAGSSVTLTSATTSADLMPIYYPLSDYTFSIYAKTGGTSETLSARIQWYDISKTPLTATTGSNFSVNGSDWSRVSVTSNGPSTAAYASVELDWPTVASGDIINVDAALFENSSYVLDFFDGDSGPENSTSLAWEGGPGNANAARSHFYKNKYNVQTRLLAGALDEYLTYGTSYVIYLDAPQT